MTFQCTLSVTDNGYPTPKTDTATLVINVVRGTNPVFGNQNLNVNTREDVPVGTVVENRISATRTPAPQSPVSQCSTSVSVVMEKVENFKIRSIEKETARTVN